MAVTTIVAEHHDRAMQVIDMTIDCGDGNPADKSTTHKYYGFLVQARIQFDSTKPTDAFDMTVKDEFGTDLLNGAGSNISTSGTEVVITQADLDNGMACSGLLTLDVDNAANSGSTANKLYLYIARYQ